MRPTMTTAEVMDALSVRDPDTVYALVKSKRLPAIRLGRQYRFSREIVEAFIRGERVSPSFVQQRPALPSKALVPIRNILQARAEREAAKQKRNNHG